jgi:hypothetical protein
MKTPILLLILCLLAFSGHCQRRGVELSHYIFPEFVKGTVLMKSGVKNPTMLNYNALTEEMIFDTNGKKLAIARLEDIDTVYIEDRKFFPLKDKFVELIYRDKIELYAAHKCSVVDPGKPAAYGGTSQTSSTTSYSSLVAGGLAYQLKLPDGYTTKPYNNYWLKRDGEMSLFISLRQLSKLFDDKSDRFKKYVKEHKVEFDQQESVVELVKYLEQY